jgi:hypothetical protein
MTAIANWATRRQTRADARQISGDWTNSQDEGKRGDNRLTNGAGARVANTAQHASAEEEHEDLIVRDLVHALVQPVWQKNKKNARCQVATWTSRRESVAQGVRMHDKRNGAAMHANSTPQFKNGEQHKENQNGSEFAEQRSHRLA